jgi:precorrin-4 methylase
VTIHFIGAGPGAPDLITVRGRDLIARCPVSLYAGSLVPREMLTHWQNVRPEALEERRKRLAKLLSRSKALRDGIQSGAMLPR